MKRFYIILVMCALTLSFSKDMKAQIVKSEAFFGINLSQVDADGTIGYKRFGLHGGLGAIVPVYSQGTFDIDFNLEVAFNQRGSHDRNNVCYYYDSNGDGTLDNYRYGSYDLYMTYLEVPVLIYFSDKQIYSLGLGASYGRLVGLREYECGERTNITLNTGYENGGYKLSDWCFLAEGKIRLHERWKLGIRFQHSLFSIRKRYDLKELMDNLGLSNDLTPEEIAELSPNRRPYQKNNNISIRVIYVINEERSNYLSDEYQFTGDNPKIRQKSIDKKLNKLRKQREKAEKKAEKSLND